MAVDAESFVSSGTIGGQYRVFKSDFKMIAGWRGTAPGGTAIALG
jgi:hypothetical protein